jgi:hypothetical protein
MKKVVVELTGTSPLSFGKYITTPKNDKESHADFEERTWKERLHVDDNKNVIIPNMMVKNVIAEAAKYRSEKIPGKRNATYTKHFEAGVMVLDNIPLGINSDSDKIIKNSQFVPSDGRRGGTTRVLKNFPTIDKGWKAKAEIFIIDETITRETFENHMRDAGAFIGIGTFRPRNNGYHGRFTTKILSWEDQD